MAPSDGRSEVPDSEDEPMTSSPIDFMDGAADKLSATARVPLQDTQDAPTEPARPHQANAEDVANMPGTRTDGLDVDQSNASSDVEAKLDDGINMQPETMASEEARLTEANDATLALNLQQTLPSRPDAIQSPLQQPMSPRMTSSNLQESESEAKHVSDDAMTDQYHPVHTGSMDINEQQDVTNNAKFFTTHNTIQKRQPTQLKSGVQIAAANDFSNDNVHISDPRDAHLNAPAPQTAATSDPQDHDSSSRRDVEQAHPDIEKSPASDSTSDIVKTACHDHTTIPVSTATTTSFTSQECPEAGANPALGIKSLSNEPVTTTPPCDAPSIVNLATQPYQKGDDATTSNASTPSTSSHPASTRGTASNAAREDSEPVTDPSPIITAQTTSSQASASLNAPSVAKTPQEITLAELKAQKAAMLASLAALPAIQVLMEENATSDAESGSDDEPTESDIMKAANKIVKEHIKLLHEYNELKDVGQGLMGLIADQRGVRIVEVQEEFGIEAND